MSIARQNKHDVMIDCWMVGDASAGKSNLLSRALDGSFTPSNITTISIGHTINYFNIKDKIVKARIWDIPGSSNDISKTIKPYDAHSRAQVCFIVYDVTDEQSFQIAEKRLREIAQLDISIVLIGNKCDIREGRVIETDRGAALAREFSIPFYETSAKTFTNVTEALEAGLVNRVKKAYPDLFKEKNEPLLPQSPAPSLAERFLKRAWKVVTAPFRGVWWLILWPFKKCFSPSVSQDQTDYQTLPSSEKRIQAESKTGSNSYSRTIMPATGAALAAESTRPSRYHESKDVAKDAGGHTVSHGAIYNGTYDQSQSSPSTTITATSQRRR